MRNIVEHPITKQEVLDCIDTALQREDDDDRIGGVEGLILRELWYAVQDDDIYKKIFKGPYFCN